MKASHWIIAAAALACSEPLQAGVNDPEMILYRFPGVRDDGGGNFSGVATVFFCTNFSGELENIRLVTRFPDSSFANNSAFSLIHLATLTVSTHVVTAYTNQMRWAPAVRPVKEPPQSLRRPTTSSARR